jgi:thiamine phosphate synthase YjbQ (UPF0047 family)
MTSIEVPVSIAAALPTLSVMDITNEVSKEVASSETGFFEDIEALLGRVVPDGHPARERLVAGLLGPRTESIPVSGGALCLGQWQRVMLFSLDGEHRSDWSLTLIGA